MYLLYDLPIQKVLRLLYVSSVGWGFPILAAAAFMRALRVRLTGQTRRVSQQRPLLRTTKYATRHVTLSLVYIARK
ncbi:hypothetical protein ACN38_g9887 [Penicillium nordicum]|uniref:Uncharacterized protein n=1 Tax=Penicillium nordicum TaxID=229535 RepID=A0A0M8NXF7_9EURO|nr:hypothetical protein ACN38_g9887 [Penicillium nordicum]